MTIKDLIEQLKNLPQDAKVKIEYAVPLDDGEFMQWSEAAEDVHFDKYSHVLGIMSKKYKENLYS